LRQSRSFKEYVKNNLDNQLWKAIEDYLSSVDPSTLDLRLNKVRDVGEVELYDTELQFVDVSDLPGSAIEFDAVLDATIIVYDEDRYHNDESEAKHQWFMVRCRGDLACKLSDLQIYEVSVYDSRNRQRRPMSNALVPIIHKENLEKEAEAFLRKYYKEALLEPMWLDPSELARRMHLTVLRHRISEDMSVFGQIYFCETDAELYDDKEETEIKEHVLPGTIVVDPSVAFQRNLGAFNNTIVHECVHWDLHKKAFALEQLFNEEASQIKCKVIGGIEGPDNDDTKWMEWQANALAPRIQMPLGMFKRQAAATIRKYRDKLGVFELCELMPMVIDDLAAFYMVSRTSAKLRMIDAGYEEAAGSFIYIDGHYVRPHAYKKGAIKPNQTYSIPAQDAAIQTLTNPKLKDASNYLFIDSHFVLNHPRYVYQDENGETRMTDYARYHVDECCLSFELSIRGKMEERYHRECFLNRDQGSPIDFDIIYTGENGELDNERRKKLIHDTVLEEANVLDSLSNNYTQAWKQLLKWRGISQAELSRRTGITEKTIGNIINGETTGTLNNVILMCLGANLPWAMSEYILQRSGHQFRLSNDDHILYRFVLMYMYPKGIPEIQTFLQEQGAAPL
ncbi:MAG: helix-turn-helix transcriptional regulator, partial [Prevotella sp.]|nr:helix-turn-helix transcriptional regulator [Prevotella sp.]